MRAELRFIRPRTPDSGAEPPDRPIPPPDSGDFLLGVGPAGEDGMDLGRVSLATPAALDRWRCPPGGFRGVTVPAFEPEAIAEALREHISAAVGETWPEVVGLLRPTVRFAARVRARGAILIVTPLDPDPTSDFAHLLRDALYGLAASGAGLDVVLNLSEFDRSMSALLGIFINFRKRILQASGDLRLCHVPAAFLATFRQTGLDAHFRIDPDEATAIQRIRERAR